MKLLHYLALCLIMTAAFEVFAQSEAAFTDAVSPDRQLKVFVSKSKPGTYGTLQLVSQRTSETVAAMAFGEKALIADPQFLWSADSSAVAIQLVHSKTESFVYALLKLQNGNCVAREISNKTGNLGKLGYPRKHWVRIVHTPVSWSHDRYTSGTRFLDVRTQVWDKAGQRYTVTESQRITPEGEVPTR